MTDRINQLKHWIKTTTSSTTLDLQPLASDASQRRYFRVIHSTKRAIVMDAPPELEDHHLFVQRAHDLRAAGLPVPEIYAHHPQGFVLMSDLGDQLILDALTPENRDALYTSALTLLLDLQSCALPTHDLPVFDEKIMHAEFKLFNTWYLEQHLHHTLNPQESRELKKLFQRLVDSAQSQPQVLMHRDYHARNLMLIPKIQTPTDEKRKIFSSTLGLLDFQDAALGPITYDLISLLKDAYVTCPKEKVNAWSNQFQQHALEKNLLTPKHMIQFPTWLDLMGMQRHLKVLGIFSRLHHRDKKSNYLQYMPRILSYLRETAEKHNIKIILKILERP